MNYRLSLLALLLLVTGSALGQETTEIAEATHAGWLSVVPPLLAILLALLFRQVLPALFAGVWIGAWIASDNGILGLFTGLLASFDKYVKTALADSDHAAIILFSLMIGGMVGIISRNGGMQGVVNRMVTWATDAKRASIATAAMGIAVFFDDYANTLVVGNTMRPVTDRLRVSREKLAYIVDSTAAPVACIAFVTTWIGYEVGLLDDALKTLGVDNVDAYGLFLNSIAYSFYPILAIAFVFMITGSGRDFGAMLKAERRAQETGIVEPETDLEESTEEAAILPVSGKPQRAINAILPVFTLVSTVIIGLFVTGVEEGTTLRGFFAGIFSDGDNAISIREVIGNANSYTALIWGSLLGMLVALTLSLIQRILSLKQAMNAWFKGVRGMFFAMIILTLAWALAAVTEDLGTASYLVELLQGNIPSGVIPALVFVLAAATAFATGSSWGTMGILMPLVVPLIWALLGTGTDIPSGDMHLVYSTIACVLAGAVWGDHCSPISDTTILSSMASGCDHIAHVRTQLPYAVLVGLVSLFVATLPVGFGLPWWLALVMALILLFVVLWFAGEQNNYAVSDAESEPA